MRFLVILEPFSCFPGVFSRFAHDLSQNRIKAFRRCFSAIFLFPFLFFSFLSSFLHSVFSVCVCFSVYWLSVYDEEGREEYMWEIRQRGGRGCALTSLLWGCALQIHFVLVFKFLLILIIFVPVLQSLCAITQLYFKIDTNGSIQNEHHIKQPL